MKKWKVNGRLQESNVDIGENKKYKIVKNG